jgi:hypothetical protein
MSVTAMKVKNTVESLRDIVQDLLVPELKSLKVSIDSLRSETGISMDALRSEMRLRDEKQTLALKHLSDKLDSAIDIRERLASLEARIPRA